jgi:hypothetical protein
MTLLLRAFAGFLVFIAALAVAAPDQASRPVAAANLFPAQNWLPPPVIRKPEPPKAPPLPFKYLGQLQEDRGIALFLERGNMTLVVRAGETVDGAYHVEKVTPTQATFIYLLLNESQQLALRTQP